MSGIEDTLRQRIAGEHSDREAAAARSDWPAAALTGGRRRVLDESVFFTPAAQFQPRLSQLRQRLAEAASADEQYQALRTACDLSVGFASFLPYWRLAPEVGSAAVASESESFFDLATTLAARWPAAAGRVLAKIAAETSARLTAEAASDAAAIAAGLTERGIAGYVEAARQEASGGYLRRVAELRAAGACRTELGNDYAAHLEHAMLRGASFVTSNPPLVAAAWDADPGAWDPVVDAVIAHHPEAGRDELARHMTLEVVLANMALLRPIFLLTEGRMGYVSLQVNPKEHANARLMVADAQAIYHSLTARLAGGVPNVVFKLPATRAGLEACAELTAAGIGVNITVNFGLFQEMAFAPVIARGHALSSYLTLMNGRLSFPVRDELLAKAGDLAADGLGEADLLTGAAWAGVAVLRKLQSSMISQGYDLTRVKPLVASLRWYTGPQYSALPGPCPDVTEVIGVPVLTIFPNIRRLLDTTAGLPVDPSAISRPVPVSALTVLGHSEIFRQAYWLPGEVTGRPERPIALDDDAATAGWPPVRNTLDEFARAYDRFADKITARRDSRQQAH